jgi:hypothetical protein
MGPKSLRSGTRIQVPLRSGGVCAAAGAAAIARRRMAADAARRDIRIDLVLSQGIYQAAEKVRERGR